VREAHSRAGIAFSKSLDTADGHLNNSPNRIQQRNKTLASRYARDTAQSMQAWIVPDIAKASHHQHIINTACAALRKRL
jgi:hypothetical protein